MLSKKYFLSITLVLLTLSTIYLVSSFSSYHLIIKVNNKIVFIEKIDKPIDIEYFFIHSSERTPWIEYWMVRSDGIYVDKLCWVSGGAGHPSNTQDFNNYTVIIGYGRYYCALNIRRYLGNYIIVDLGHAINASLVIGGNTIRCSHDLHCLVELIVRKINVLESLIIRLSFNISPHDHVLYYTSTALILS